MIDLISWELLRARLLPEDYKACQELPENYLKKMFSQEMDLHEFYNAFSTVASLHMNEVTSGDEYIVTHFIENTGEESEYAEVCNHLFDEGSFKTPQRIVGDRMWDTKIAQLSKRSDFGELLYLKTQKASWVLRNSRGACLLPFERTGSVNVNNLLTLLEPCFALLRFHRKGV